jgi:hypothetical protein
VGGGGAGAPARRAPPPHPDLLHSPSKTGVNALMARGEKETALHRRAKLSRA